MTYHLTYWVHFQFNFPLARFGYLTFHYNFPLLRTFNNFIVSLSQDGILRGGKELTY